MGDTWLWEVEEHQERCSHVVYAAGEGIRIQFQHDSWSGPISLKELYQEFFVSAVVQDALISYLILYAPDGGGRSWNFSVVSLMTGKQGDFTLSLSMFLQNSKGGG